MASTNKEMNRTEWNKTPYSSTEAKDTIRDIDRLFTKYGIKQHQIISSNGPHGRPGFAIQFVTRDKTYLIGLETLPVRGVNESSLMAQIKRAVYFQLKVALEACSVFFSPEEILFPFLVLPSGQTFYQTVEPHLDKLPSEGLKPLLQLPKE